jgi:hypothetical protein
MGVVIIERAVKRGNVRTFDEEYNRGYTDIWASEIDADFDLLFSTWNESFQGLGDAIMSPLPPLNPNPGDLWWRTTDGNLFIYYDDGNSKQFVPAVSTGQFIGTGLPTGQVPPGQGDLSGYYPSPVIAPLAVTTPKIEDGAVTDVKITSVSWAKVMGAPTTYPPSGPAGAGGGALTGTYPNPGVKWGGITGVPAAFPPTGPAGGALTGTYPDPGVDYTKITNVPAPPVIPTSLPPSGPVPGASDLAGFYPAPILRVGSTAKTPHLVALGSPIGLTATEEVVVQLQWSSQGGKWIVLAGVHGHYGIPSSGPTAGVTSQLRFDGTLGLATDGYPLSAQAFGSTALSTANIVPFSIMHATAGTSANGNHFFKLTARVTGNDTGLNGVDSGYITLLETT